MPNRYFELICLLSILSSVILANVIAEYKRTKLLLVLLTVHVAVAAQPRTINFHHLTTTNGLSDPVIRSIASDKYGFTWFGTLNGLNRFNGYDVKVFQHQAKDSFSLPENIVPAMLCDNNGTLWVAQSKGIYKYDYANEHFILQPGSAALSADKMLGAENGKIYIGTSKGMVLFDTKAATFTYLNSISKSDSKILLSKPVNDFCLGNNGTLCIATDTGIIKYVIKKQVAERVELGTLKNKSVLKIAADSNGSVWASYSDNGTKLLVTDKSFTTCHIYSQFNLSKDDYDDNNIHTLFADYKGNIWVATNHQGLFLFNPLANSFTQYTHDPLQPASLVTNFPTVLYQDKKGFMWIGTEGYGAEYFHPDKNLFHSLQQSYNESPTLPDNWTRVCSEDKNGNLWLGTANGLAKYDPAKNKYTIFQNTKGKTDKIFANSIRSVLCDDDVVWIGTKAGLNRYHISTEKMDFLGENDPVPDAFFWNIIKDNEQNVWFGCSSGLYLYNNKTRKIRQPFDNALLAPYCKRNIRLVYQDSHNRLWICLYWGGLIMYDAAKKQIQNFEKNIKSDTSLNNDIVTSVAEDNSGIIWITTLSGLYSHEVNTLVFKHYSNSDANISEITSSLLCDDKNRLWLASSRGLYLLDSSRKFFTTFDINDGLPTIDFNYQSAYKMRNGTFVYPSLKGFVLFNPNEYYEKTDSINVFISSFKIFEKEFIPSAGIEQMANVNLGYDQNFFSFQMTAVNYANPNQNWYAYKLEPFDKEWIYTKNRIANYTNVPGGDYTFYYKTSTDNNKWNVPGKKIKINVATVFYKTWWFILSVIIVLCAAIYLLYKTRIAQKEKVLLLEKKTYLLEKEKAQVMYESLKQQLNPHFLFNSLTSLSSLISSNPVNAKQFLERMSKIYRYILQSRDSETVHLSDELKLAEIYTQLQQTRFKEGLQVRVDVPGECMSKKIAPVTLQNLIENAIKHNIVDVSSPLVISISVKNQWLVVQNNLQKKSFVESSNKQGLHNMQSLYYYLSGKQIIIDEDAHYYTIKIPLL